MRGIIWLSVFVLGMGVAQAHVSRPDQDRPVAQRNSGAEIAGSVWLQERPPQGSVMPAPDFSRPLLGPHGGVVADLPSARPAS